MKKFNQVLAFGGSHVAGSMIEPPNMHDVWQGVSTLDQEDNKTKPLSFPNQFANLCNVPCINYARTGASDDRSIRLLPQALATNKDSFVMFSWAAIERTELFYPDPGSFIARDTDNYIQLGINWVEDDPASIKFFKKVNRTAHPINDLFMEKLFRPTVGFNNFKLFNSMLYVESLCKQHAVDFVHIFGTNFIDEITHQSEVWDLIDKSKILKMPGSENLGYGSYNSFHRYNNSVEVSQQHYNADAHLAFAKFIYEQLK